MEKTAFPDQILSKYSAHFEGELFILFVNDKLSSYDPRKEILLN